MTEFTEFTEYVADAGSAETPVADSALDSELMAFVSRRKRDRQAKQSSAETSSSASPESDITDVEVVSETRAVRRERLLEDVVVDEVDPSAPKRIGEIPPSNTGGEMPTAEESYAIHRVEELRSIAASTKTFQPDDETLRAAKEAQQINIEAMDDAKPKGKAAGGGGGKGVPRGRAAKAAQ